MIFRSETGGAANMCQEMKVTFLGSVPLDPRVASCCDNGRSFIEMYKESAAATAYKTIIESTFTD
jgi:hypothetical protein